MSTLGLFSPAERRALRQRLSRLGQKLDQEGWPGRQADAPREACEQIGLMQQEIARLRRRSHER